MSAPETPRIQDFTYRRIEVDGVGINAALAGSGDPVLLMHGYPQTHFMWRHIAPALAETHSVVATDLRGYGDSDKPAPDTADEAYSKRAMALDQLNVMRQLGADRFHVIGHDRGARVGHRLALDHPYAVEKLVLLDIVPTRHVLTHVTETVATAYFHWFFLAARGGIPERLLGHNPDFWVRSFVERLLAPGGGIEPEAIDEYIRCFSDPAVIAASCADYRAATTTDMAHDAQTAKAGQKIECPALVLWGEQSFVGREYDPIAVWREYATSVRGRGLPAGHFLPEEVPDRVISEIRAFLA
jgi:haloacetate dehalogenase